MKTEKLAKEKIREINKEIPGIENYFKGYSLDYYPHKKARYRHPHDRGYAKSFVEDVETIKTKTGIFVGIKWEEHSWKGKGGIEWREWLQILYIKNEGEIYQAETRKQVTRSDKYSNSKVWEFDFIKLQEEEGVITICQVNEDGEILLSSKRWFYERKSGRGILIEGKMKPPLSREEKLAENIKRAKERGAIWLGKAPFGGESGC